MSAIAAAPVGTRRAVSVVSTSAASLVDAPTVERTVVASRLRLTRRGRGVLATLAAVPLLAGAALGVLDGGGAVASDTPASTEFATVTVQGGDTLWQLAADLAPQADPREVIADIVTLNALSSPAVHPGQQLAVPTQYAG